MSIPAFSITSSGIDITAAVSKRIISLRVTDDAGEHADSFEIELANPQNDLHIPLGGEVIGVGMGYAGDITHLGSFIVDEPEIKGPPDIVIVKGKAAPFDFATYGTLKPFQSRKTRSFDQLTLGAIIEKIASEVGFNPSVDPALASIAIPHVDQTAESSMNLLTRLARTYNAIMKPKAGHLCFVQRGQALSASGQSVGGITIDRSQSKIYGLKINQRSNFDRVRTRSHDVATGNTFLSETTKDGTTTQVESPQNDSAGGSDSDSNDDGNDAIYEHPHDYPDQPTAEAASKAIYNQATQASTLVSVQILGNAKLVAGGMLSLTRFNTLMNKQWWISKVEHEYTKAGFVTVLSGMIPATTTAAGSNTSSTGSKEFATGAGFAADQ